LAVCVAKHEEVVGNRRKVTLGNGIRRVELARLEGKHGRNPDPLEPIHQAVEHLTEVLRSPGLGDDVANNVEHETTSSARSDPVRQDRENLIGSDSFARQVHQLNEAGLGPTLERQPKPLGGLEDLSWTFFEGDEDPWFASLDPLQNELEGERDLSDSRAPRQQRCALLQEPPTKKLIEPSNTRR